MINSDNMKEETCTNYEKRYVINFDKFCNASLGSTCVTEEKVCTQSYEELYACAL